MFRPFVAATCALFLSACVQQGEEGEISSPPQAPLASVSGCLTPVKLTAPVPAFTQWNGTLPPALHPDVVWMLTPLDLYGFDWGLYQMEVTKDYVVSRTKLSAGQRMDVMYALGQQLATLGGVRVGGPQPGPIGDPADLLARAKSMRASGM